MGVRFHLQAYHCAEGNGQPYSQQGTAANSMQKHFLMVLLGVTCFNLKIHSLFLIVALNYQIIGLSYCNRMKKSRHYLLLVVTTSYITDLFHEVESFWKNSFIQIPHLV